MLRFANSQVSGFTKRAKTKTRSAFVKEILGLALNVGESVVVSKAKFATYGEYSERMIENGPGALLRTKAMKNRGVEFAVSRGIADEALAEALTESEGLDISTGAEVFQVSRTA